MKVQEGMTLAMIHAPLMVPEGAVKKEGTFIVGKRLDDVTSFDSSAFL